jgi:hypothetical protein
LKNVGFCSCCGRLLGCLCKPCGCTGCDGEFYWSEWHNDPPYCHDPCNCHGDWIGHGGGCGCGGCECGGCNGCESGTYVAPAEVQEQEIETYTNSRQMPAAKVARAPQSKTNAAPTTRPAPRTSQQRLVPQARNTRPQIPQIRTATRPTSSGRLSAKPAW